MPVTRQRKEELVQAYREWLAAGSGLVLTSYSRMSVRSLEDLRRKVREAGGEYHVVKNRLMILAMRQAGLDVPPSALEGATAIGFTGSDVPAVVKTIVETARTSEGLQVKAALLEGRLYDARQVERLAELPPLPVVRAQLLGLLQAPASRLTGVLSGSVRQVVNVVKAYSETQPAGA
ncbi:MAG TPA: 50S ribosomal protein L10 [Anaerolineales bacterium]|nr:50S ribosomal protein L10 [Anaerolineales bacterium]